jgi:hypothetical protein
MGVGRAKIMSLKGESRMESQGNGTLKRNNGEMVAEVEYSITPGRRKSGRATPTLGGSFPPVQGKKESDHITLVIIDEEISFSETGGSFVLETDDNRRFNLVVTSELSHNVFAARGTEIESA